jgi:hypothetical protein
MIAKAANKNMETRDDIRPRMLVVTPQTSRISFNEFYKTMSRRKTGAAYAARIISLSISLNIQIYVMNAMRKAPPRRRGGGSVCRDGGVSTVILVKLLNNA